MTRFPGALAALAALSLLAPAAASCAAPQVLAVADPADTLVTIESKGGAMHRFRVESARNHDEQERGLMFRTNIPQDGGMLFAPFPGDGGPPREASFWMVNTPTALDILFIRKDGTIASIAADAAPFTDDRHLSGEPVSAVLELLAGRAAALGIAPGDKVRWEPVAKK
ncbi:DUF192 domain-containing protein [Sphingomonas canadensis]|uniref:DUF192 domain-containing protein n=1 Tax=Sphingomonas canadensis TaxID=1219257 RepID=A0ABW3H2Z1_9SPHN|nr:DUF192 domain-containing protein [Sphingomonas canadensis]MCW3835800.1 DUF192 domain-containing protein [Sphingomonas canadensis]